MSEMRQRPDGTRQSRGRDLVLAYLLVVPLAVAAGAAVGASSRVAFTSGLVAVIYAGSVLMFLGGALRGAANATLLPLVLFVLGLASVFAISTGLVVVGPATALAGFLGALLFARCPLSTLRLGPVALLALTLSALTLLLRDLGVV